MRRPPLIALAGVAGITFVALRLRRRRALLGLVREYFSAWESGDPTRFERIVSADYKGHVNALAGTEERDRDGLGSALAAHAETFTNSSFTIEDLVTDSNRVAARTRLRATHGGDGHEVETSGLVILRIADGRITEEWASWDYLGLANQLGVEVRVEA